MLKKGIISKWYLCKKPSF